MQVRHGRSVVIFDDGIASAVFDREMATFTDPSPEERLWWIEAPSDVTIRTRSENELSIFNKFSGDVSTVEMLWVLVIDGAITTVHKLVVVATRIQAIELRYGTLYDASVWVADPLEKVASWK